MKYFTLILSVSIFPILLLAQKNCSVEKFNSIQITDCEDYFKIDNTIANIYIFYNEFAKDTDYSIIIQKDFTIKEDKKLSKIIFGPRAVNTRYCCNANMFIKDTNDTYLTFYDYNYKYYESKLNSLLTEKSNFVLDSLLSLKQKRLIIFSDYIEKLSRGRHGIFTSYLGYQNIEKSLKKLQINNENLKCFIDRGGVVEFYDQLLNLTCKCHIQPLNFIQARDIKNIYYIRRDKKYEIFHQPLIIN
jgi:hypothetical protein